MWDSKYNRTAQTSAWCETASGSGTGFQSTVSTSTSGSSDGLRQNDPGLRRWQSLSHLEPESAAQSFHSSLGTELRGARGVGKYGQSEVVQWLQDAHERLDKQLECLRSRDAQLSFHMSSPVDMMHRLSEAMRSLEQEEEAANLTHFERNQKRSELHEKVLKLEKDLMQTRLSLDRGGNGQMPQKTPATLSRTLPASHDESNRREKQKVDMELCDVETRAGKPEKEQLHTSAERMLWNQIEELNQRLSDTIQNHSEVQEQLTEANNKISQACLEKAILSTQVLKLEDNIKDQKTKLTEALSDKHNLTQVNETLMHELGIIRQKLEILQSRLQELTAEKVKSCTQITGLEAENSQLTREKEELLSKMNESGHGMKDKCSQLRESLEALQMEKQKLRDQCLCLEAKLVEREQKLQRKEEEYHKNDAARVQNMEELKAVASHWTEKWQQAALTLQSTQEELEALKRSNCRNQESDSLLEAELDACKQQLELLHTCNKEKACEAVEARDKETETDLAWEPPPDHHSSQNKYPQVCVEGREMQWLRLQLAEKEKLLQEKTEALMSLETLRETEKTEAQTKISALELKLREKVSEEIQDDDGQANVWTTDSLKAQLEESGTRMNQLQQEKMLAVRRLQTLQQIYPTLHPQIKDEKQSSEGRKEKPLYLAGPETDQQRKMINEQLKNLFKKREGKTAGKNNTTAEAGAVRAAADRWNWQLGSGLMPVYEEDEESDEPPGVEEEEAAAQERLHDQTRKMWAMRAANGSLKAKNKNRLQDLKLKPKIQPVDATAEKASQATNADLPKLGSEESDPPWKPCFLSPDGIFLAQRVDICSPDEDEDEGEHK